MVVQLAASAETWSWNPVAYAASQLSTTSHSDCAEPRSIRIHCGSLKALDQRVPAFPSTAAEAGNAALSVEEASAAWPSAALVVPQGVPALPYTWNSHREYPYGVARAVPYIRTYLPLPDTLSV